MADHSPIRSRPTFPRGRLNRAATVLWREQGQVQIELGSRRLVLDNVAPADIAGLQGRNDPAARRATAGVLAELHDAGFLVGTPTPGTARSPVEDRPLDVIADAGGVPEGWLEPDLAALRTRHGDDGGVIFATRRRAVVALSGMSRLTVPIASALAGAGVGTLHLMGSGTVRARHSCAGGLPPAAEGTRFADAARQAVLTVAPSVDVVVDPVGPPPDLMLLTEPGPLDSVVRDRLHLDRITHLPVELVGGDGVIGPLVVPGQTTCTRCVDLHRADRDPAWPMMALQLASRRRETAGSDGALAVAIAGVAVLHSLAYLEASDPPSVGGTVEWQLPDLRLRRRSWPVHPRCDCGAPPGSVRRGRMEE